MTHSAQVYQEKCKTDVTSDDIKTFVLSFIHFLWDCISIHTESASHTDLTELSRPTVFL